MLRIAICIDSLAGGGAEKVILHLAKLFVSHGCDSCIFVLDGRRDYDTPTGVAIHCFADFYQKAGISSSKAHFNRWFSQIEQLGHQFDLVLSNLEATHQYVAHLNHINAYYVIHNSILGKLNSRQWNILSRLKLQKQIKVLAGKNLIAVSKGVATEIEQSKRLRPKSIKTIYNPLDVEAINIAAKQVNLGVPNEDYIIHVGRVAKQKRHDLMLKALSEMTSKIKLVLLCRRSAKIEKLAQKLGVSDRIVFAGFQANPYPWIYNAKCLVSCSDFEGLGMVLLEALACGTPVISTDCDFGPREIMTGALKQWLVPVGEAKVLADTIDKLLLNPPVIKDVDFFAELNPEKIISAYLALSSSQQ